MTPLVRRKKQNGFLHILQASSKFVKMLEDSNWQGANRVQIVFEIGLFSSYLLSKIWFFFRN